MSVQRETTARRIATPNEPTISTESMLWGVVLSIAALFEAWITRAELNPDGVSYLDLADAVRGGDLGAFVQGYWSPLYPLLLAVVRTLARTAGVDLLTAVHLANALVIAGGAWLLHRWMVREAYDAGVMRALWATYAICALVFTRINSVTPDALLLVFFVAITAEITRRSSARWWLLALLLGSAYLAKTSVWPWLFLSLGVLLSPWSSIARRDVARIAGLVIVLMLLWIVPMSAKYGTPTLGSTGRLNACWFLRECDSRSPDTHAGDHVAYGILSSGVGAGITYARFDGDRWTWAPWSDPTAWSAGVRSHTEEPLSADRYAAIVVRNIWEALRFLARYLYVVVLIPAAVLWWPTRQARKLSPPVHAALLFSLLGAVGIAQFIAVQVQPRLMAPFAYLHVAGLLVALAATLRKANNSRPRNVRRPSPTSANLIATLASFVPLVAAAVVFSVGLRGEMINADVTAQTRETLLSTTTLATRGFADRHVVVIGDVFPLLPSIRALNARVVAQVRPASVDALGALSARDRQSVLQEVSGGRASAAWKLRADGRIEVMPLR